MYEPRHTLGRLSTIARDVMAMQTQGKALKGIRTAIDEKYGPIGLSMPTPQPPG
jgi:hypothetical protein